MPHLDRPALLAAACCSISSSVCQLLARADDKEFGIKGFSHFPTDAPASCIFLNCLFSGLRPPISSWLHAPPDWRLFSPSLLLLLWYCFCLHSNDFSRMVAEEYLRFFNFTGLALDQALRWENFSTRHYVYLRHMKVNPYMKYTHIK